MSWYLDPDPAEQLEQIAAATVEHIAVTHVLWDVFGKLSAPPAAMENLHTATEQLRNGHNAIGQAVAALTGHPRNTPAFAPAAVTLALEKRRAEVPIDDFEPEDLSTPIAAMMDEVSPAMLAEDNMKLLAVADVVIKGLPDAEKARGVTAHVLDASGKLITGAVHLAKAYRYCKDDLPEVDKDRWLDDFSWSVAGQRRDRKSLYLAEQPTSPAIEEVTAPTPEPAPGMLRRWWNRLVAAYRASIDRLSEALRR